MIQKRQKTPERILAALLSLVLTLSYTPLSVFAEWETLPSETAAEVTEETETDEPTEAPEQDTEQPAQTAPQAEEEKVVNAAPAPHSQTAFFKVEPQNDDIFSVSINGNTTVKVGDTVEFNVYRDYQNNKDKNYSILAVCFGNQRIEAEVDFYSPSTLNNMSVKITKDMADDDGVIRVSVVYTEFFILKRQDLQGWYIGRPTFFEVKNNEEVVVGKIVSSENNIIEAVPEEGYRLLMLLYDEQVKRFSENDASYNEPRMINDEEHHNCMAYFARNVYSVGMADEVEHLTSFVAMPAVEHGDSTEVTLIPDEGYGISSITVNGEPVDPSDYQNNILTVRDVTEDKKINVVLKKYDFSFNKEEATSSTDNSFVYSPKYKIEFKSEVGSGIRLYDENGIVIDGNEKTNPLIIPCRSESFTVTAVEVFHPATGFGDDKWHKVVLDKPFTFSFQSAIGVSIVMPSLDKGASCYSQFNAELDLTVADDNEIQSILWWIDDNQAEAVSLDPTERNIILSSEYNGENIVLHVSVTDMNGETVEVETESFSLNTEEPVAQIEAKGTPVEGVEKPLFNTAREITVTIIDQEYTFNNSFDSFIIKRNGTTLTDAEKNEIVSWEMKDGNHQATLKFKQDGAYVWSLDYKNKAGLSARIESKQEDSVYQFTVDTKVEEVSVSVQTKTWEQIVDALTFGIFSKDELTVIAKGKDTLSGITETCYYVHAFAENEAKDTMMTDAALEALYADGKFSPYPNDGIKIPKDMVAVVYVRFQDGAGNHIYCSSDGVIIEDRATQTTFDLAYTNNKGDYYENVMVNVTVTDLYPYSGIKSVVYWVKVDNEETERGELFNFGMESATYNYSELEHSVERSFAVKAVDDKNQNVKVCVEVYDNAGNQEITEKTLNFNIDKPEITLSYNNNTCRNGKYFNAPRTATLLVTDKSELFDLDALTKSIVITATDAKGKPVENAYKISKWEKGSSENTKDTYQATIDFEEDANYTFSIDYTNKTNGKCDNISCRGSAAPFEFTIDTTKPAGSVTIGKNLWETLLEVLSFGVLSADRLEVTMAGNDNLTTVDFSRYVVTLKHPLSDAEPLDADALDALPESVWQPCESNTFMLPENPDDKNYAFVVYVRISDLAGNYTYVCSDGHIIDNEPCDIRFAARPSKNEENNPDVYDGDVKVDVTVTDTASGIAYIEYWLSCDDEKKEGEVLFKAEEGASALMQGWSKTFTIAADEYNSSKVILHVIAIDNCGTSTEKEFKLDIDATAPKITIDYGGDKDINDSGCFNAPREARITFTERSNHFDRDVAKENIIISAVDENNRPVEGAYSFSNWETVSGGKAGADADQHIITVYFNSDANYTFNVSYTDSAGNPSGEPDTLDAVAPYAFTIDTTPPKGTIKATSSVQTSRTWDEQVKSLHFDTFSRTQVTVKAESIDALSGVGEIAYFKDSYVDNFGSLTAQAKTDTELESIYKGEVSGCEFVVSANGITLGTNEKAVVYARIADKAGNAIYLNTDGLITDNTDAACSLTLNKVAGKKLFNGVVEYKFTVNEVEDENTAYSGIKEISYAAIAPDGQLINKSTPIYTWSESEGALRSSYSGTFTIDPKENKKYNQDGIEIRIIATDNAGNTNYHTDLVSFNTDIPEITITFVDEFRPNRQDTQYFQSRYAEIMVKKDRGSSFDGDALNELLLASISAAQVTDELGNVIEDPEDLITLPEWEEDMRTDTIHYGVLQFNYCGQYAWEDAVYVNAAGNSQSILSKVKDSSGKTSTGDQVFVIDTVAPSGEVTIQENSWGKLLEVLSFNIFSNTKFDVTAEAIDYTSPVRLDYCIVNSREPMTSQKLDALEPGAWTFYSDAEYEGKGFSITEPENYVIYFRVTDYAGNYAYICSDGHIIDKAGSNITITPDQPNANNTYNKDVNVRIEVADPFPYSGIKNVTYRIEADGVETQSGELFSFDMEEPSYGDLVDKWSGSVTVDAALNNSCDVKLTVLVIDNAGNKSEESRMLDIDTTPPAISVSYNNNKDLGGNGYFDAPRTATVVITERTHHFDAQTARNGIVITAVDINGNPVEGAYTISDFVSKSGSKPDEDTHTATISYPGDANYTFEISYTDKAGNAAGDISTGSSVAPKKFTVDTTAPFASVTASSAEGRTETWDELATSLFFGFWSNSNIRISGEASDTTSPVGTLEYYKHSSINSGNASAVLTKNDLDAITDWKPLNPFDVRPNEQFTVYLKVTNMAGIVTYVSTNGLIVDDNAPRDEVVAPDIKVTPQQSESGIYNGDVKLDIKVTDPLVGSTYSGLRTISYRVTNMGYETQSGTLYTFGKDVPLQGDLMQGWTGSITVNSKLNNSNDVAVEIYAEDNARNASSKRVTLKIDTTPPNITVSYSNNNSVNDLFNAPRTARITVRERNFSGNYVNITATKDGQNIAPALNWSYSGGTGNGDDTTWYAELTFAADGDYTFGIDCTDLASNKSTEVVFAQGTIAPTSFTIDATAPIITVVFQDKDTAPKDNYYKDVRTATITITEEHFDPEAATKGITLTGDNDGKPVTPVLSSWTSHDLQHTATVVFTEDAKYHMAISYTDTAGNRASGYSGDFYVDKSAPALSVTVNGKGSFGAYKDDIKPEISYSDVNFDKKTVSISMSAINVEVSSPVITGDTVVFTLTSKSGKKLEWKASLAENTQHYGELLNFENFPNQKGLKEFDDIYTLNVSLTDKSGQSSHKSLSFSVNRYGSTYDISEVQEMLGTYLLEEKPVVVGEVNPDELTEYSVTLFKNNETLVLEEDTDYLVTFTGKDGEWHKYTYTIFDSNFAEDGVYSILLHSKDKAGNVSENTLDTKDSNISFAVDKTPPTATVTNLENGKTYVGESHLVVMTANDNLKLAGISVYLDSKDKLYKSWSTEDIEELMNGSGDFSNEFTFEIDGNTTKSHNLRVVCLDAAGIETELTIDGFYITTNPIVPWLKQYGWILGILLLLIIISIVVIIVTRRKRAS